MRPSQTTSALFQSVRSNGVEPVNDLEHLIDNCAESNVDGEYRYL